MQALFTAHTPLILASGSPRRRLFLEELGLDYTLKLPTESEALPMPRETPEAYALRAATLKGRAVVQAGGLPAKATLLAADTVVAVDETILGKPQNAAHALEMLRLLVGRQHTVISAVYIHLCSGEELIFHDATEVFFHWWAEDVLQAYAHCGEPLDKAGAYAIQGQGAFLVERVVGSWSTVVGLPVTPLVQALLERGIISAAT